jgi:uncharacterized protein (DUF433 family)
MAAVTLNRIRKTPNIMGGKACIRQTRIAVWTLVEWKHLGVSDARLLSDYPDLTADDLQAASDYYEEHAAEIDADIRENNRAWSGMAALYADENVPFELVELLAALGHDVLTARDDGRANRGINDPDVMQRAITLGRAVLTNNRNDYHRLHRRQPQHAGIITYTNDPDRPALAGRIDLEISLAPALAGQLIKILRPRPAP